ncbi:hypothetical protein SELMODRAFT_427536 [Selaginella moellendorffii]|uniref:Uncharacterized protein n=1 Tax=Selaginella moellendorffii TaxID=88036 RepID=D8SZX4_SELML|nr:hypothetical protein SELMODRAFT_427536 [Selaginella moellendorffii]
MRHFWREWRCLRTETRFILSKPKTNKWRTRLKTLLPHLILQHLLIPQILLLLLIQPRLLEMYEGSSIVRMSKRMSEKPASTLYADIQMRSFHPSPLLQRMTSKSYLHQLHINKYEKKHVCPLFPMGSVGNVEIVIKDYFQLSNNVLAWNYHALCPYSCHHNITRAYERVEKESAFEGVLGTFHNR